MLKIHEDVLSDMYSENDPYTLNDDQYKSATAEKYITVTLVDTEFVEKGRWRTTYYKTYKLISATDEVSYWGCSFEEGNDENCDSAGFDADKEGFVELIELEQRTKTIVYYVPKGSV